ncbi:MAG: hypothetical protein HY097_01005 [Nitrospinae bacterium]|nr:hypothetical protein [Nitrospinota bacterium]
MKKILSVFLMVLGMVAFTVSSSSANSVYYAIPLWGDTPNASQVMRTTISVTSLGTGYIRSFSSTGATVTITLYNDTIKAGTANAWSSITVKGENKSTWGNISKTFTSGHENFLADTQNANNNQSTTWVTATGWAANTTNWGYGVIQITTTGSNTVKTSDFAVQGFFYGSTGTSGSFAGFPITISDTNY